MRKYLIAAMAVTALAAFAVPGTAFAVSPNVSSLDAQFNPGNPGNTATKGGLFVETSTLLAGAGAGTPTTPAKEPVPTRRADIDFDHGLTFATNTVTRCTGDLSGTTQSGMKNCGDSYVGGGYATLCVSSTGPGGNCDTGGYPAPTNPPAPGVVNAQISAYNGPKDGGQSGNQPTILLQSVSDHTPLGPTTVVLTGSLFNSPLGGDFGKRLDVPIPLIGGGAGALTDFSVNINNGGFIKGECDDGNWSYSAQFNYNNPPGGSDVVTDNQGCS
jgi:hypothetical protein